MCHKEPKQTKKNEKKAGQQANEAYCKKDNEIPSDIWGSYTGIPLDGGMPIQDADDL